MASKAVTSTTRSLGSGSYVSATPDDERQLASLADLLGTLRDVDVQSQPATLNGPGGRTASVPRGVVDLLSEVVARLLRGEQVSVVSIDDEMTTQQAADVLGFSRQYLIRLLEEGRIPHRRTGTHRRVRTVDVLAWKARRDRERHAALDELADLSQEAGGYSEIPNRDR